jgi:hypothetical protein
MNILTIQRSKWRRGGQKEKLCEAFGYTRLLNDQGNMCCLGFDALANGFTPEEILNKTDPESFTFDERILIPAEYKSTHLKRLGDETSVFCQFKNTKTVNEAIRINDEPELTDDEREEALHLVFRQLGYDGVVFVD